MLKASYSPGLFGQPCLAANCWVASVPELVYSEINRRIETIQCSTPEKLRKESISKELLRVENSIKKLLDAYQSDLLQIDELRDRMPQLRNRQKTLQAELAGLKYTVLNQKSVLRLANSLKSFLRKLRKSAEMMDILERQRVLRLMVKEILVDYKNIRIKHSIPLLPPGKSGQQKMQSEVPSYLLRSGRRFSSISERLPCILLWISGSKRGSKPTARAMRLYLA